MPPFCIKNSVYVEKLSNEQIKHLISPKFHYTINILTRQKFNGRLYVGYTCYSFNCTAIFEDFRVVFSDFSIDDNTYRKFMLSQFEKQGYFEDCANFIKNLKQVEAKEEINSLKFC